MSSQQDKSKNKQKRKPKRAHWSLGGSNAGTLLDAARLVLAGAARPDSGEGVTSDEDASRGTERALRLIASRVADDELTDDGDDEADSEPRDPVVQAYADAFLVLDIVATALFGMPAGRALAEKIDAAEAEYTPLGPPMSPVTESLFGMWTLFQATHPRTLETAAGAIAQAAPLPSLLGALGRSHLQVAEVEAFEGGVFTLVDIVTRQRGRYAAEPSDNVAHSGDLLLTWLAPPPPGADHGACLTKPYRLVSPTSVDWRLYFDRALPKVSGAADRESAYRMLMLRGLPPHGDRFWLEFVFEAYCGHTKSAILCQGLPDIDESRPHSQLNADRDDYQFEIPGTEVRFERSRLFRT